MELQELHSYIQEHQPNICQISVLRDGSERYCAEWNGYQRTDCVHIASATKSVMALLIIIAAIATPIAKTQKMREVWFYVMSSGAVLKIVTMEIARIIL